MATDKAKVSKEVLYPGEGEIPNFDSDSKAVFHFKTFLTEPEKKELDCSRHMGQPFELLIGKKFKLEIWEELIKTMRVHEVSRFTCDKSLVGGYHFVSKNFRNAVKKNKGEHVHDHHEHTCSFSAMKTTGYTDLDVLLNGDKDLVFEIELLSVNRPGEYKKESWQMDVNEKLDVIPKYKEQGNKLYTEKKYKDASEKYAEALGCLEQLVLREKPGDKEWLELEKMKIPFLLNYSQCKLLLGEYYDVIKHTTTVLEKDKDNVKALFRRARALKASWDPEEARKDFKRAEELDPSLAKSVKKELDELDKMIKEHDAEDRNKLKGLFS